MPASPEFGLVLLRGLGRDSRHWLDFPTKCEKAGLQCHAFDLPVTHYRNTNAFTTKYMAAALSDQYAELLKQHQCNWVLVGLSLGGMVGLEWAALKPKQFSHVVVVNSSSQLSSPTTRLQPSAWWQMARILMQRQLRQREGKILKMISNIWTIDSVRHQELVRLAEGRSPTWLEFAQQLAAATRFVPPPWLLPKLLILASTHDHMVSSDCSRHLADFYSSPVRFHSTAGHDLPLDDPEWLLSQILDFIKADS